MKIARSSFLLRTFLLLSLGATACLLAPSTFQSPPLWTTLTVEILPNTPAIADAESSPTGLRQAPWFIPTQVATLESEALLTEVATQFDLAFLWHLPSPEAASATLQQRLQVHQLDQSAHLVLSLRHRDPNLSSSLLVHILERYHQRRNSVRAGLRESLKRSWDDSIQLSEQQIEKARAILDHASADYLRAQQRFGGPEIENWTRTAELRELEQTTKTLRTRLDQLAGLPLDSLLAGANRFQIIDHQLMSRISAYLGDRSTIEQLEAAGYGGRDSELTSARFRLAASRGAVEQEVARVLRNLRDEVQTASARENSLRDQRLTEWQDLRRGAAIVAEAQAALDQENELLQRLRASYVTEQIELNAPAPSFRIESGPELATAHTLEDMLRTVVRAPILAVLFGFVTSLLLLGLADLSTPLRRLLHLQEAEPKPRRGPKRITIVSAPPSASSLPPSGLSSARAL